MLDCCFFCGVVWRRVIEFDVTMNGTLKSTEFKNNLITSATVLQDVTVAGDLTASATTYRTAIWLMRIPGVNGGRF